MRAHTHIVEITSFCNLRCPFCIVNNGMTRPHRTMPLREVARVLDEIAALGPGQEVYLFNYGEPMMHPHVEQVVRHAHSLGLRTKISTNGVHLARKGPAVVRGGLDVLLIDLDGVSREAHATYRVGSDAERVKGAIRSFMTEIAGEPVRTEIVLQTIVHKQNVGEMASIRAFAREVGITRVAWKALGLDLGVRLSKEAFDAARARYVPDDKRFDRYAGLLRESAQPCPFSEMNGVILSNGDYVLCTHDADGHIVLGNVLVSGYRVLRETAFAAYRERVAAKALPICVSCSMSTNLGFVEDLERELPLDGPINFGAGLTPGPCADEVS